MRVGKNIRLFKNDFLERCTYVHPLLPLALWGPIIIGLFARGLMTDGLTLSASCGLAAAGFFIWTLAEYLLHRYVFHFNPTGPIQERIAFLIHGIHHTDPGDERRLLMPPIAAISIAAPIYALFYLVLGAVLVKPFFAAFLVGYLCYDYTHFAVHFWNPRAKFLKRLKHNHMRHHFVHPDKRFGVSNMLWDHVFRTHIG